MYFLVELQNRPDGITNTSIVHYSTYSITLATYHQRVAAAITSKDFVSVALMVIDNEGVVHESNFITCNQ